VHDNGVHGNGRSGIFESRNCRLHELGSIYDHVGGKFHRYTVDSTWTVPDFEKMLYDNGQIVEYFADLWATGQQEPGSED
jgi:uncharacterized protein YyaL (SSP411 family)